MVDVPLLCCKFTGMYQKLEGAIIRLMDKIQKTTRDDDYPIILSGFNHPRWCRIFIHQRYVPPPKFPKGRPVGTIFFFNRKSIWTNHWFSGKKMLVLRGVGFFGQHLEAQPLPSGGWEVHWQMAVANMFVEWPSVVNVFENKQGRISRSAFVLSFPGLCFFWVVWELVIFTDKA